MAGKLSPHLWSLPSIVDEMCRAAPAMVLSQAAIEGRCDLCTFALDIFASLYGTRVHTVCPYDELRGCFWSGGCGIATGNPLNS